MIDMLDQENCPVTAWRSTPFEVWIVHSSATIDAPIRPLNVNKVEKYWSQLESRSIGWVTYWRIYFMDTRSLLSLVHLTDLRSRQHAPCTSITVYVDAEQVSQNRPQVIQATNCIGDCSKTEKRRSANGCSVPAVCSWVSSIIPHRTM